MTERVILISPKEIQSLVNWIATFEKTPRVIKLIGTQTGIGQALRAEVEITEDEGVYKDLTNYEEW